MYLQKEMNDLHKYRKYYVTERAAANYIKQGKCPVCMLRLKSQYHTNCSYLDDMDQIVDKNKELMG